MNKTLTFASIALSLTLPTISFAAPGQLTVKAVNKLPFARSQQTLELSSKVLEPLGLTNLPRLHVRDAQGKEVLCQAIDTDYDAFHKADTLIFQADFAPGETKTFTVIPGSKLVYTKEQFRAHGRFVRERFDDFAWENDRIAHRTYGKALETWAGEPLTSSTIDIWSKRVPQMVVDDWYAVDNYHQDTGQGADFYSAGKSRGCGGDGLWAGDQLWVSKNFVNSRVLANGPIRVLFELDYEAFDVNGKKVSEVRRVSLDAGANLDHYQITYKAEDATAALVSGIGLKKVAGEEKVANTTNGWMAIGEKVEKNQGMQALGIVVQPKALVRETEDKLNNLFLVTVAPDKTVSYWAGFYWDKTAQFADFAAWKSYLDQFSQGLQSPIEITVSGE
jgi:hypothetical protein